MSQLAQDKQERVSLSAFVDRDQQQRLVELARQEDRSVSAIVRRALASELETRREGAV